MTRRLVAILVIATALFAAAPAGASNAPMTINGASPVSVLAGAVRLNPPPPPSPSPTSDAVNILDVVDLLNAERAIRTIGPLQVDHRLMQAAQGHSDEQARFGTMTHVGRNGSNAGQRITAAGFVWSTYGENVAYGYGSPALVMAAWMASAGHRQNNLDPRFTHVGVGLAYDNGTPYWTLVFGTPR